MKTRRTLLTLLAATLIFILAIQPVGAATPASPLGVFTYIVQLGDTLATISRKFGVSADRILDANNLRTRPDLIFVGEKLIIPTDISTLPSYVNPFFYTVLTGDTVQTLANKFYIDKFSLRLVNNLAPNANLLTAGMTILIPAGPHRYVVQRNDSIQSIAAMFGTSVNTLLKYNTHLGGGTSLFPGQNVFVPIVFNAPMQPIPGASTSTTVVTTFEEGIGGGGEGTGASAPAPNSATGLQPTDSAAVAQAANASVITAFKTITMPQNVVNLSGPFTFNGYQVRRHRVDPSRPNGAITTIAIEFRGGDGTYTIQRYDDFDGPLSPRGVNLIGIYVNAGGSELWNNIEVEVLGNCESVNRSVLFITTSGVQNTATLQFKSECPAK